MLSNDEPQEAQQAQQQQAQQQQTQDQVQPSTSASTSTVQQQQAPAKPMFSSKHPLGRFQKQAGGHFKSPTDNIQSPATKKVEAKRNHLLTKIKPRSLADQLSEAAAQEAARKQ